MSDLEEMGYLQQPHTADVFHRIRLTGHMPTLTKTRKPAADEAER